MATQRCHLVLEPSVQGHYYVYLRLLVREAAQRGDRAILGLTADGLKSPEYALHLRPLEGLFSTVTIPGRYRSSTVRRMVRELGADHVLVPNGDRYLMRLALRPHRSTKIATSGIVMQDPDEVSGGAFRARLKMRIKRFLLRRAEALDNVRVFWLRGPGGAPRRSNERIVNDPIVIESTLFESPLLDALGELDGDTFWFAMVGVLNPWKNPDLVVETLLQTEFPRKVGLVVAGQAPAEYQAELERCLTLLQPRIAIAHFPQLLSNAEFDAVVRFSDCVILAYSTHAPNSTLGKAAALGTRIVAAGSDHFQGHAKVLAVGAITAELSVTALSKALVRATESGRPTPFDRAPEEFAARLITLDPE